MTCYTRLKQQMQHIHANVHTSKYWHSAKKVYRENLGPVADISDFTLQSENLSSDMSGQPVSPHHFPPQSILLHSPERGVNHASGSFELTLFNVSISLQGTKSHTKWSQRYITHPTPRLRFGISVIRRAGLVSQHAAKESCWLAHITYPYIS